MRCPPARPIRRARQNKRAQAHLQQAQYDDRENAQLQREQPLLVPQHRDGEDKEEEDVQHKQQAVEDGVRIQNAYKGVTIAGLTRSASTKYHSVKHKHSRETHETHTCTQNRNTRQIPGK